MDPNTTLGSDPVYHFFGLAKSDDSQPSRDTETQVADSPLLFQHATQELVEKGTAYVNSLMG